MEGLSEEQEEWKLYNYTLLKRKSLIKINVRIKWILKMKLFIYTIGERATLTELVNLCPIL